MTAYRATVRNTAAITPLMRRVTLGGEALRDYEGSGLPDESCRIAFGADLTRNYTIRRRDPLRCEIDIDFVLHEGGVAATWAATVEPGAEITISGAPAGKYAPADDVPWRLLVGDATALPAIGRAVEELPAGAVARVIAIVDNPDERQTFDTSGDVTIEWVYAHSDEAGDALRSAVRDRDLPDGPGYTWVAGEAAATRDVRRHLRHTLGLPASRYDTIGYWRFDAEAWEQRYRQVSAVIDPRLAAADEIADDEQYFDAVDEIYIEVGL
ncbi:siderophore-interacting protein [Actinokineospora globicatena]|uniref:siderophore-interacting protein n=1 Tax=Actinokineospora globicatena TaxID=103729 RepID=UPI0020A28D6C|nr:siderophore-interacting protein [Actinokineospora globicatena]MCP2305819.1 NADPH-dependent ferric siderophore reductase, contains FAD-binding and SIP domains [Actinokineospora globicatena]GLW80320.1 siderophore-interacting protein [Actinokineospora globicatena]GLW87148.1 siderophore-interacting protein [Actinokineospora globicatena]